MVLCIRGAQYMVLRDSLQIHIFVGVMPLQGVLTPESYKVSDPEPRSWLIPAGL